MCEIVSFLWEFSVHVYSQLWIFLYFVRHYLKLQENSVKLQIFFSALNQTPHQSRLWRPADCCALMLMVRRYKGIIFASMIITNTYKSESSWDLFRSLDQLKIDFVSAWGDFLFVPRGLTPRCPHTITVKVVKLSRVGADGDHHVAGRTRWNRPNWAKAEMIHPRHKVSHYLLLFGLLLILSLMPTLTPRSAREGFSDGPRVTLRVFVLKRWKWGKDKKDPDSNPWLVSTACLKAPALLRGDQSQPTLAHPRVEGGTQRAALLLLCWIIGSSASGGSECRRDAFDNRGRGRGDLHSVSKHNFQDSSSSNTAASSWWEAHCYFNFTLHILDPALRIEA